MYLLRIYSELRLKNMSTYPSIKKDKLRNNTFSSFKSEKYVLLCSDCCANANKFNTNIRAQRSEASLRSGSGLIYRTEKLQ